MRLKLTAKLSRREGVQVSERSAHAKALVKRPYAPGVHGPTGRSRPTDFGKQLREKQKAKRVYGLNERQFQNVFQEASRKLGNTGEFLVQMLESRLDNVIFRAGFAKTRAQARQAVSHAHFNVNGKKVNIPSYNVRAGEVITIRDSKKAKGLWKGVEDTLANKKETPSWLSLTPKEMSVKVTGKPQGMELQQQTFDPKMIVEFYSR